MLFMTEYEDLLFKDSKFIGSTMRIIQNCFSLCTVPTLHNFVCLVPRLRNSLMLSTLSNFVAVSWHIFHTDY